MSRLFERGMHFIVAPCFIVPGLVAYYSVRFPPTSRDGEFWREVNRFADGFVEIKYIDLYMSCAVAVLIALLIMRFTLWRLNKN